MRHFVAELLWLGTAGLVGWWIPKTFLVVQIVAAAITLTLMLVERHFR